MINVKSKKVFLIVLSALMLLSFAMFVNVNKSAYAATYTYGFESGDANPASDWVASYLKVGDSGTVTCAIGNKSATGGQYNPYAGTNFWGANFSSSKGYAYLTSTRSFGVLSSVTVQAYSSDKKKLTLKLEGSEKGDFTDAVVLAAEKTFYDIGCNENSKYKLGTFSLNVPASYTGGYLRITVYTGTSLGKRFCLDDLTITDAAPLVKTEITGFTQPTTTATFACGTTQEEIAAKLATSITATANGTIANIPTSGWTSTNFVANTPGTAYTFTGTINYDTTLYKLGASVSQTATVTVTVSPKIKITAFAASELSKSVAYNTSEADVKTALSSITATATKEDNEQIIGIAASNWVCETAGGYLATTPGEYTFTADAAYNANAFDLAADVTAKITVTVTLQPRKTISAFAPSKTAETVEYNTPQASIDAILQAVTVSATVVDGAALTGLTVSGWACAAGYTPTVPAAYTFTGTVNYDTNGYEPTAGVTATIDFVVTVLPKKQITAFATSMQSLTVEYGTAATAIQAQLALVTATATVSGNPSIENIAVTAWTSDSYDPNTAGNYDFTAAIPYDGEAYELNGAVATATVVVTVEAQKTITAIDKSGLVDQFVIAGASGSDSATVLGKFPTSFTATFSDTTTKPLTLSGSDWSATTPYDVTVAGDYIYTASLPVGANALADGVTASVSIKVTVVTAWAFTSTDKLTLDDGTLPTTREMNVSYGDGLNTNAIFDIEWYGAFGTAPGLYEIYGTTTTTDNNGAAITLVSKKNIKNGEKDVSNSIYSYSNKFGTFGAVTVRAEFLGGALRLRGGIGFKVGYKLTISGASGFDLAAFMAAYNVNITATTVLGTETPKQTLSSENSTIDGSTILYEKIYDALTGDNGSFKKDRVTNQDIRLASFGLAMGIEQIGATAVFSRDALRTVTIDYVADTILADTNSGYNATQLETIAMYQLN